LLIKTGVGLPCAAELESNFGDKVIGFAGTEHHILIPTLSVLSLAEKTVKPVPEGTAPLTEDQAKALLRKVNPNPPSQHF
jgi:4a-hydroxytetrahydrobiopterin dehydratase